MSESEQHDEPRLSRSKDSSRPLPISEGEGCDNQLEGALTLLLALTLELTLAFALALVSMCWIWCWR